MTKKQFEKTLLNLKNKYGLCQEIYCKKEENAEFLSMAKQKQNLPIDIRREDSNGNLLDKFYRIVPLDISKNDFEEYIALKQTQNIETIKNCVLFFTILTVVSLISVILILAF